jgi:hypothetical protein
MRIAISGTHDIGKSKLIEAFMRAHPDYVAEPEVYEALEQLHDEAFAAEPTADDFFRQLEYHVGRLATYSMAIAWCSSAARQTTWRTSKVSMTCRAAADARLTELSRPDPRALPEHEDLQIARPPP